MQILLQLVLGGGVTPQSVAVPSTAVLLRHLLACYLALPLASVALVGVASNTSGAASPSSILFASDSPVNTAAVASPCPVPSGSQQLRRALSGGAIPAHATTTVSLEVSSGRYQCLRHAPDLSASAPTRLQVRACSSSSGGGGSSALVVPDSLEGLLGALGGINGNSSASSVLRPFLAEAAGQSGVPLSDITLTVESGAALAASSPTASPSSASSGAAVAAPPLAILIVAGVGGLVALVLLLCLVGFFVARQAAPSKPPLTSSPEHSVGEPQSGDLSVDGVNPLVATRALESAAGSALQRAVHNTAASEARGVSRRTESLPLPVPFGDPRGVDSKWSVANPLRRRAEG